MICFVSKLRSCWLLNLSIFHVCPLPMEHTTTTCLQSVYWRVIESDLFIIVACVPSMHATLQRIRSPGDAINATGYNRIDKRSYFNRSKRSESDQPFGFWQLEDPELQILAGSMHWRGCMVYKDQRMCCKEGILCHVYCSSKSYSKAVA